MRIDIEKLSTIERIAVIIRDGIEPQARAWQAGSSTFVDCETVAEKVVREFRLIQIEELSNTRRTISGQVH